MSSLRLTALVGAALLLCAAQPIVQAQGVEQQQQQVSGEKPSRLDLPLEPDYVISVTVEGESEPTGSYLVDAAGNVGIREAGVISPVQVKDMTPAQAQAAIAKFLSLYLKKPVVTVTLVQVPRPVVYVTGAVKNAGSLSVPSGTTLPDVLTRAEWTETADLAHVRLTRFVTEKSGSKQETTVINFAKFVTGSGDKPDPGVYTVLRDKDRIYVPSKTLPGGALVSITGAVAKNEVNLPYRQDPPLTVREAISTVGGLTLNANRKAVNITRQGLDQPIVIDYDKAEAGDPANNIKLEPGDAVFVPALPVNSFINLNGGFYHPGKIVYDKPTTLLQAINEAGGVSPGAKAEGTVTRSDGAATKVLTFNWHDVVEGKGKGGKSKTKATGTGDFLLQPGDTVYVEAGVPKQQMGALEMISAFSSLAIALTYIRSL
jgi:protein involved in polysaccharide export with SLBB domain